MFKGDKKARRITGKSQDRAIYSGFSSERFFVAWSA